MTLLLNLRLVAAAALLALASACTATPRADLQPGERPSADSLEAGLWMVMEDAEARLKTSGRVIPDPELQAYVQDLACRLAGDHCPGLRTYVVRRPGFNASMAPNGFMSVWSGLILRCENEDQLATVIGHEIAHYVRRHSVQRWETMRDSLTVAQLFGVVTAGLGVPLGGFAVLGAYGHVQSYGRDQEREADSIGFGLMSAKGYDPHQSAQIWRNLVAESEAAEEDEPDPFFASHPPSAERMETLTRLAEDSDAVPSSDSSRFHRLVDRHRAAWLEDEVDLGHYKQMQVLLDRLKQDGATPGLVWYYQGEILRRDSEVEEKAGAIEALRKAITFPDAPAIAHRSLALLLAYTGDHQGAYESYATYLATAPEAEDREMIRFYMSELEKKT